MKVINDKIKVLRSIYYLATPRITASLAKAGAPIRLLSIKLKDNFIQKFKSLSWKKVGLIGKYLGYIGAGITFVVNLYVNAYNTVSQRYEEQYSRLAFRIYNLINQIPNLTPQEIVKQISRIQAISLPIKPDVRNVDSIIKSFADSQAIPHEDHWADINNILRIIRDRLDNIQIMYISFSPIMDESRGRDYYFYDFEKSNFKDSNLYKSILTNLKLTHSNFFKAEITESSIAYSRLVSCDLRKTHIAETNFFKAILNESDISNSILWNNNFFLTSFLNVNLSNSSLDRNNFQFAILIGADLTNSKISNKSNNINSFQGALYNSKVINHYHCDPLIALRNLLAEDPKYKNLEVAHDIAIALLPCASDRVIQPTKFPDDFNPREHGMVDISELIDLVNEYKKNDVEKVIEDRRNSSNKNLKEFIAQENQTKTVLKKSIDTYKQDYEYLLQKIKNSN